MFIELLRRFGPVWNAPDADGGAAAAPGGDVDASGDTDADAGGGAPDANGGDAGAPADTGGDAGAAAQWWEDKRFDEKSQTYFKSRGLDKLDPLDALAKSVEHYQSVERKIGIPQDRLLTKPGEGEDRVEWMKQNADVFGIPETPEGYEIKRPDSWPKDMPWNEAFQAFVELRAGEVAKLMQGAEQDYQAANAKMEAELQRDWGADYGARMAQAKRGMSYIAEQAGLNTEDTQRVLALMTKETGDAQVVRMADAIGRMLSEDNLGDITGGASAYSAMSASEAQAELDRLTGKDGEYYKAIEVKDREKIKSLKAKVDQLTKIAAG
jgi:DNA-binding phage protein